MVSSDEIADHNDSSDKLQQRVSPRSTVLEEIHHTKIRLSEIKGERSIPPVVAENELKDSDATACALQSDQEGSTPSLPTEKHLQSPDNISRELHPLQSGQDIPSIIREKVSKDGYNWRKYGQKHVKGNEFIRSYYRCTHPNCQAKKQLEQSNNGQVTDSICIGQHNHPRPQLNTAQPIERVLSIADEKPDNPPSANVEDKASIEHGCLAQQIKPSDSLPISKASSTNEVKAAHLQLTRAKDEVHNNEDPESKRQKKDNSNVEVTRVEKSSCESRVVVQTSSEVDFVNDGYRWRKYGQKQVKGNTNPRSYYRCSNPGCPVKKHVERASYDSKIVITTYEGQHDHEIPLGRTVTHNVATKAHTMAINGKPGTKSLGNTVSVDTGECSLLDSASRLNEKRNGWSMSKSEAGDPVEADVIGHEKKIVQKEQQNDDSGVKEDSVGSDIICHSSSEVPCRSTEQLKDEVKAKSEGSKECLNVVGVHDTPGPQDGLNKQSTADAEPAQN